MDRTFPFWIAVALLIAAPALAQSQQGGAPDLRNLSPQDAARLNAAVSQSDDATRKQFQQVEQQLRDANHPSARMLEATRPQ